MNWNLLGCVEEQASLAALSTISLPCIPLWLGIHKSVIVECFVSRILCNLFLILIVIGLISLLYGGSEIFVKAERESQMIIIFCAINQSYRCTREP